MTSSAPLALTLVPVLLGPVTPIYGLDFVEPDTEEGDGDRKKLCD